MQSSTTTPTQLYDSKLNEAWKIVEDTKKFKDFDKFKAKLVAIGADDDATLRMASYEDIEGIGVPKLKAKLVANIFRAKSANPLNDHEAEIMVHKNISEWPVEMLIKNLDPTKPLSPVAVELKKRVGERPVVVFKSDNSYWPEATLQLINQMQEGLPAVKTHGDAPVYKVGEGPWRIKDACPLHPDMPLIENRCIKCQQSWGFVSKTIRRVVYYIGKRKMLDSSNRAQVRELFNMASHAVSSENQRETDPAKLNSELCDTYPEAFHDYNDAKNRDALPGLKVDIGADEGNGGGNPFGSPKKF